MKSLARSFSNRTGAPLAWLMRASSGWVLLTLLLASSPGNARAADASQRLPWRSVVIRPATEVKPTENKPTENKPTMATPKKAQPARFLVQPAPRPPTLNPPQSAEEKALPAPRAEMASPQVPAGSVRGNSQAEPRTTARKDQIERLLGKPIHRISVDITPPADPQDLPPDVAAGMFADLPPIAYGPPPLTRAAPPFVDTNFCHYPLYFEEVRLERYGHSHGILQPAYSAAHFFATIPALPYKMVQQPPRRCLVYRYPYEAGRPAPYYRTRPQLRWDAGAVEAATIVGLILLIP